MNIKDIKIGETYNVRVLASYNADDKFITFELPSGQHIPIGVSDFETVTPVKALERFIILHNEKERYYEVFWKDDDEEGMTGRVRLRATYWYYHPPMTYTMNEAKERAEAECARLNAEHRKEQK